MLRHCFWVNLSFPVYYSVLFSGGNIGGWEGKQPPLLQPEIPRKLMKIRVEIWITKGLPEFLMQEVRVGPVNLCLTNS